MVFIEPDSINYKMEEFKPLNQVTEPDVRHALIDALTGSKLSLCGLHAAVGSITLNDAVPDEIESQFNVARNLVLYTWFSYSLDPVAQLKTYIIIEHALNIRDGLRDRSLKKMLRRAVSEGWIADIGFRHVVSNPNDPQKYCRKLIDILPSLRNQAAHGCSNLHQHGVGHLQICADFINQLFGSSYK